MVSTRDKTVCIVCVLLCVFFVGSTTSQIKPSMYSGYSIGLDVSLQKNTNVNGDVTYSFPAGFSPVQNETSFQISNQTNINNSLAVGLSFGNHLGRKSVFNAWLLVRASYTASSFNFDITKAGIPDVFYNNGYDTVRSNNTAFTLELNTHTIHIEPLFRIQLADAPLLFTIGPGVYIPIHQYATQKLQLHIYAMPICHNPIARYTIGIITPNEMFCIRT